jgi:hypothetical protein
MGNANSISTTLTTLPLPVPDKCLKARKIVTSQFDLSTGDWEAFNFQNWPVYAAAWNVDGFESQNVNAEQVQGIIISGAILWSGPWFMQINVPGAPPVFIGLPSYTPASGNGSTTLYVQLPFFGTSDQGVSVTIYSANPITGDPQVGYLFVSLTNFELEPVSIVDNFGGI